MYKSESTKSHESRVQVADSLKACSKSKAFNCHSEWIKWVKTGI